ncbi:hypothetical protein GF373_04325, partial [bacterium]|nr:hypothetical protein [bacterium]
MKITCNINRKKFLLSLVFASFLFCPLVYGEIERFIPAQGGDKEVWRITHNSIVRDWANYHNTDAWSPDGRYICYTHYAANDEMYGRSEAAEVHIVDLHTGEDRTVDHGTDPRWANNHNRLFYVKFMPENGSRNGKGSQVMWLNVDTGELTRIAYGVPNLGETDCDDRWIYGYKNSETWGRRSGVRIPICADSRVEHLEGLHGIQWVGNPVHPVIFCRKDHRDSEGKPLFFEATRYWFDPEGKNIAIGSPMLERCHQSWSGDGKYYLLGNSQMRGRLWNEPFPSNLHLLSAVQCGDISPCGKSGRWVCGSSSYGSFPIADLRSGDGETCLQAFSVIAYPGDFDASGPYDNDAKGSPDGTKIVFVSNYDLKDGPLAEITIDTECDSILEVDSTEGFPAQGRLLLVDGFRREVLSYESKTPNRFEGLKRGLYRT